MNHLEIYMREKRKKSMLIGEAESWILTSNSYSAKVRQLMQSEAGVTGDVSHVKICPQRKKNS